MIDSSYSYKFLNELGNTFNTTPEDISKVQAEVEALKTEVAENTDAIEQNTGDIAANTAEIEQVSDKATANASAIDTLKSTVEQNTADIAQAKATLETDGTNIEQLQTDVAELKARPAGTEVNSIAPLKIYELPSAADNTAAAFGSGATCSVLNTVAVGRSTESSNRGCVAVGAFASARHEYGVAIGANTSTSRASSVSVGSNEINPHTRLITNVTDPELDQDAATKHYVDNHASTMADTVTAGHVKVTHEVTNDSTDGVAVSPDAVYAYAPAKGQAVEGPFESTSKVTALASSSDFKSYSGDCEIYGSVNKYLTGHIVIALQTNDSVPSTPKVCNNSTGVSLPVTVLSSTYGTLTPVGSVSSGQINAQGQLIGAALPNSGMAYIVSFFGQLNVRSN